MKKKLLLIFGPSGVGKSVIISELKKLDARFTYISPYMTRPLRKDETDKISISVSELRSMEKKGELLVVNELYGILYGTPKISIKKAFNNKLFPLIDWPINKRKIMLNNFPDQIYSVYLEPPNLECLYKRLTGRNNFNQRFEEAKKEIDGLYSGKFNESIDFRITSEDNKQVIIAKNVYNSYLDIINQ